MASVAIAATGVLLTLNYGSFHGRVALALSFAMSA